MTQPRKGHLAFSSAAFLSLLCGGFSQTFAKIEQQQRGKERKCHKDEQTGKGKMEGLPDGGKLKTL
jgi:hypothetical protein